MGTRAHDRRFEFPNQKAERPGLALRVAVTEKKRRCCDCGRSNFVRQNHRREMCALSFCEAVVGAECATFVMRKPLFAHHAAQVTSDLSIIACGHVAQLAHVAQ
jgi:hypothetical protein